MITKQFQFFQVQGENQKGGGNGAGTAYRGLFATLRGIAVNEGFRYNYQKWFAHGGLVTNFFQEALRQFLGDVYITNACK